LVELGLWDNKMKNKLIAANGSVQAIPEVPQNLKDIYKTVWEIKQKSILDMAADRGAFICQSQSLNIHLEDPTYGKLSSMHFYAWKKGLKTGTYYLRTKSAADAIKFTVDKQQLAEVEVKATNANTGSPNQKAKVANMIADSGNVSAEEINQNNGQSCSLDDPDCEACGS